MAFAVRALWAVRKSCRGSPRRYCFSKHAHSNSNSHSNSNPLLLKLLQVPNSHIKTTLDQEMASLQSSQRSWDFLITSLSPSSSDKARLVLVLIFSVSVFRFIIFLTALFFVLFNRKFQQFMVNMVNTNYLWRDIFFYYIITSFISMDKCLLCI